MPGPEPVWKVTVPVEGKSQLPPSNTEIVPPGATGFGWMMIGLGTAAAAVPPPAAPFPPPAP